MLNLILFGPPGAGKGTQSAKLTEHFGLVHLSTGDIFRAEIKGGTALGTEAKAFIDKGLLVPDEVTINMLRHHMEMHPDAKGFIFDGFPRTGVQANALDAFLEEHFSPIALMLSLKVEDEELYRRLLHRGKESGRVDDQDESTIRQRINVYNESTLPVATHYANQGKLAEVKGVGEIEVIFEDLKTAIQAVQAKQVA